MSDQVGLRPFAPSSVSFRLYAYPELSPSACVAAMRADARLAEAVGFDGIMVSEHHGGFPGYLPNPLMAAAWALDATEAAWAAPCPLLLLLRPLAVTVEDLAWLAAAYPGRVGAAAAAGSLDQDFEVTGAPRDHLAGRYAAALEELAAALAGRLRGVLAADSAVAALARRPVPLLSAAMSPAAARRAAGCQAGLLFDSLSTVAHLGRLAACYREADGRGPVVMVRRVWVGSPPNQIIDAQVKRYRSYASPAAVARFGEDELVTESAPRALAERLAALAAQAGATALNLRVHVPGVSPDQAADQLEALAETLVELRSTSWASSA